MNEINWDEVTSAVATDEGLVVTGALGATRTLAYAMVPARADSPRGPVPVRQDRADVPVPVPLAKTAPAQPAPECPPCPKCPPCPPPRLWSFRLKQGGPEASEHELTDAEAIAKLRQHLQGNEYLPGPAALVTFLGDKYGMWISVQKA
jgi:hypothetical protein